MILYATYLQFIILCAKKENGKLIINLESR